MDSPITQGIENVAGRGVGMLAGLASLRGGGLLNYMMARERMLNDPGFRAGLAGSPFTSGFFGVGGGMQGGTAAGPGGPMPAAAGVAPPDMLFGMPTAPTRADVTAPGAPTINVPGYMPGTPRQWQPSLPPLSTEEAIKEQSRVSLLQGVAGGGSDLAIGQAKVAAGIMPNERERQALIGAAKDIVSQAGPGSTVKVDIPGMPIEVGSPYNLAPVSTEEYPTYGQALAVAQARGTDWEPVQTNRGTWIIVQKTAPLKPPAPAAQGGQPPAPAAQPPPPPSRKSAPTQPTAPPPPPQPTTPPPPPLNLGAGLPQTPQAPAYAGPWAPVPAPSRPAPRVGYPSPAFDDTGASVAAPPELLAAPPAATVAAAPVPASVAPWAPPSPPPQARGGGGSISPQGFVQGMVNRGWSVPEAGAAAGNVHVESGFRPAIVAPNGDTGLLQWNGARLAGMQRYAAATGRDWRDPEAQMDWIAMERSGDSRRWGVDERGGYRKAFGGVAAPADMAAQFGHYVERPADLSATVAQRSAMATAYGGGAPAALALPAAAPAVATPSMFARMFAPVSAEAAEMPPGAIVAYPSAAFAEGGGAAAPSPPADIVPPGPAQPPAQRVPPPPPPPPGASAPPLEPETKGTANVPLSRISVRGADGTEYSYDYGSPSDFVRQMKEAKITSLETATPGQLQQLKQIQQDDYQRRLTTEADTQRFLRPQTEEEKQADDQIGFYGRALDQFYHDFPNPSDRDKYVGWLTRPAYELVNLVHDNPEFQRFVNDLAPFNNFNDIKRSLPVFIQNSLGPYVPTGEERHTSSFEQHLFDFTNAVTEEQRLRNAANRMPAGQITPAWMDAQRERMRNERLQHATPDVIRAMGLEAIYQRAGAPMPPRGGEQPRTVPMQPPTPDVPIISYGHSLGG